MFKMHVKKLELTLQFKNGVKSDVKNASANGSSKNGYGNPHNKHKRVTIKRYF